MFSTDKNIENLASLIESLKDYALLRKELFQLTLMEKIIRLLAVCVLAVVLSFFFFIIVVLLAFAAVCALAEYVPAWLAFLAVAGMFLLFFVLVYANRQTWIQQPLVRALAGILSA